MMASSFYVLYRHWSQFARIFLLEFLWNGGCQGRWMVGGLVYDELQRGVYFILGLK